jgi:hypothetical protein
MGDERISFIFERGLPCGDVQGIEKDLNEKERRSGRVGQIESHVESRRSAPTHRRDVVEHGSRSHAAVQAGVVLAAYTTADNLVWEIRVRGLSFVLVVCSRDERVSIAGLSVERRAREERVEGCYGRSGNGRG